jgi:hypothetical protein
MRHAGDDMRPRGEPYLNSYERDRLIIALSPKEMSHEKIALYLGMSRRSVGMAWERIAEGRESRNSALNRCADQEAKRERRPW